MKPIEFPQQNSIYAKNQPEYNPLPSYRTNEGVVTSCWRLTFWERVRLWFSGRVYLSVMTFNNPLQPMMLHVEFPKYD